MPTTNVPPEYLGNTDFVGAPPTGDQPQRGSISDIVGGIGGDVTSAITGVLPPGLGGGSSVPPGGQQPFPLTAPPGSTAGLVGGGKRTDPEQTAAEQAYFDIWGVEAPHGYIPALMKKGMNLFEIIDNELAKPAVRRTQYYVDRYSNYAQVIAQLFGTR